MQTYHIKTLLKHAVSFAKPFMVFDFYIYMEYFETGLV